MIQQDIFNFAKEYPKIIGIIIIICIIIYVIYVLYSYFNPKEILNNVQ